MGSTWKRGGGRWKKDLDLDLDFEVEQQPPPAHHPHFISYQRRRPPPQHPPQHVPHGNDNNHNKENRSAAGPPPAHLLSKRLSLNRSLSTRGRISVAAAPPNQNRLPQQNRKPPLPRGKSAPPNFDKERQYFQEVDAFELLEESPSPKHLATWASGLQHPVPIPTLSSRLDKWLITKKLNYSCGPSTTLSKILETPMPLGLRTVDLDTSPVKSTLNTSVDFHSVQTRINTYLLTKHVSASDPSLVNLQEDPHEEIDAAVRKLSLASTSSSFDYVDPFATLLAVCGQTLPSTLLDVLSNYCDPQGIVKVGEGTYGEAFKAGNTVCKIVPFDGELRVNGEVQKRSEELLEEVVLCRTLNHLRGCDGDAHNACTTFIETLDLKVCQGPYDHALIRAWEEWDEKHGSENDHPKDFPEKQRYVVFVLQHGGKDLESFVLKNFDEARSLLVQVTAALAVAEVAFEFEHRDLHWGNILLSRNETNKVQFTLEGKQMSIRSHGLVTSIIDFTLSRINTGEDILFLDLSSDPYLFKGPKGDRQAETYRKMKELTEDLWEGSFPRTNVLWLLYLVDVLLLKKSFERSSKDERDMRSLKKRLDKYNSAKEALFDPFFSDLLTVHMSFNLS